MKKESIVLLLLGGVSINLFANSDVGCRAIINDEPVGCSTTSILDNRPKNILESPIESKKIDSKKRVIKISEKITSIETLHDNHEVLIERKAIGEVDSCPPFCIEPLTIKGVETVGELEVLEFIAKLKEKKGKLLIDVRKNSAYKESTIPGAINLPEYMLEEKSPYQEEVLKLLGAKKIVDKKKRTKWYFKETHSLLIFGESATHPEASKVVKQLLKLGYPASKILYYRAGISSWKALGLSTI